MLPFGTMLFAWAPPREAVAAEEESVGREDDAQSSVKRFDALLMMASMSMSGSEVLLPLAASTFAAGFDCLTLPDIVFVADQQVKASV